MPLNLHFILAKVEFECHQLFIVPQSASEVVLELSEQCSTTGRLDVAIHS